MKLTSKESTSKLRCPYACSQIFHPSTYCTVVPTTKFLPGTFPEINLRKYCPTEDKPLPRFVKDSSIAQKLIKNVHSDASKDVDGRRKTSEKEQHVEASRFERRNTLEVITSKGAVETKEYNISIKSAFNCIESVFGHAQVEN